MTRIIQLLCIVATIAYGCSPTPPIKIDTNISFTRISERPPKQDNVYARQDLSDNNPYKFSLANFTIRGEDLKGCACSFSDIDETFPTENYLFVRKNDGTAYITLSNELTQLTLLSTTRKAGSSNGFTEIYRAGLHKVTIAVSFIEKTNSGGTLYEGTITVEDYDGKKLVKKITGECGC
jgi:hypothetical protein